MYEQFASVYDEFMQEVPYEQWADYIETLWKKHSNKGKLPQLVLDLACGTGTLTGILASRGYDMIGIDQSEDMLSEAQMKAAQSGQSILYLLQEMQSFELYGTVDSIVCTCDSLNYLLEKEDLVRTFSLVNNYLNPGGLFIFDLNTQYKFEQVIGNSTQAETYEDAAYIWENYYYPDEKINEYSVTFFTQDGEVYRRSDEVHYEKAYSVEEVCEALEKAGLRLIRMYDAFTLSDPVPTSERICFVAAEQGKAAQ